MEVFGTKILCAALSVTLSLVIRSFNKKCG